MGELTENTHNENDIIIQIISAANDGKVCITPEKYNGVKSLLENEESIAFQNGLITAIGPRYCDGCGEEETEDNCFTVSCSKCDREYISQSQQDLIKQIRKEIRGLSGYVHFEDGGKTHRSFIESDILSLPSLQIEETK